MMTPREMIRETLNELTAKCNYIGVLPQAATQEWSDEIVKRLNASKMLKDGVLNND